MKKIILKLLVVGFLAVNAVSASAEQLVFETDRIFEVNIKNDSDDLVTRPLAVTSYIVEFSLPDGNKIKREVTDMIYQNGYLIYYVVTEYFNDESQWQQEYSGNYDYNFRVIEQIEPRGAVNLCVFSKPYEAVSWDVKAVVSDINTGDQVAVVERYGDNGQQLQSITQRLETLLHMQEEQRNTVHENTEGLRAIDGKIDTVIGKQDMQERICLDVESKVTESSENLNNAVIPRLDSIYHSVRECKNTIVSLINSLNTKLGKVHRNVIKIAQRLGVRQIEQ